jgi:hypothetical protein
MKKLTFNEYLSSKGKVEDAVVDIHGDQIDPKTSPKNSPDGKPYCSSGKNKKSDKGLGDEGDKELIYKPDTASNKKPTKIPTMEFSQYELIPLITESLEQNPFFAENIVRDLKQKGLLGILVGEMMEHKETYKHIASLMAHKSGEQICAKLVNAMMQEEISPPFGAERDDDPMMDLENPGHEDVEVDDDMVDFDMSNDEAENEDDIGHGEPCPMCNGEEGNMECEICQGTGFTDAEEEETAPEPEVSPAMMNFQRAMMKRM